MAHMLVEANDVCLTYHEPTAETRAIEHLSFQINLGEFVAIVGPSGCGKTSVLSLLAGLMEPSEGEIHIYDEKSPDICCSVITCWIGAQLRAILCSGLR